MISTIYLPNLNYRKLLEGIVQDHLCKKQYYNFRRLQCFVLFLNVFYYSNNSSLSWAIEVHAFNSRQR